MGTRNLTCIVKDGRFRVAQYGQWDGYPSGQGVTLLGILRNADLAKLAERVDHCRFVDGAELEKINAELEGANDLAKHPKYGHLSRDTGAEIVAHVLKSTGEVVLVDQSDFASDGLYCEWAYVVDLDKRTLEVYDGFHQEPAPAGERFAYLNREDGPEYGPVHRLQTFPLGDLPSNKDFINLLESQGE